MASVTPEFLEKLEKVKKECAMQSLKDADFRDALVANPAAAIEDEYGLEGGLLAGMKFNVIEEEEGAINILIPPAPKEGELSEEELEAVAGGFAFGATIAAASIGAGALVLTTGAVVAQNTRAGRKW